MTLADRLDAYPLLPPDERAAVERDVAEAPEARLAERLAEVQALAAHLDAARGPVTADDVARHETDRALGHEPPDAARIDAALGSDTALAAEAVRVRERLARLAAEAEPPADHYARLVAALDPGATPPAARRTETRPVRADRPAAVPPRARRPAALRRLVLVGAVCVAAYGAAWTGSTLSQPERSRLAALSEVAYVAPVTRGQGADAHAERLGDALDAVRAARRTTLGLFPRYDAGALAAAAADLEAVATSAERTSAASQEARFALGRVRLQQGRDGDAARVLGALVAEGSYRAPEARRILDWIRTREA